MSEEERQRRVQEDAAKIEGAVDSVIRTFQAIGAVWGEARAEAQAEARAKAEAAAREEQAKAEEEAALAEARAAAEARVRVRVTPPAVARELARRAQRRRLGLGCG